jgi:predicted transcriptional regulator
MVNVFEALLQIVAAAEVNEHAVVNLVVASQVVVAIPTELIHEFAVSGFNEEMVLIVTIQNNGASGHTGSQEVTPVFEQIVKIVYV